MATTTTRTETLAIPLAGASQAEVRLGFGGGELRIRPAAPGNLVDGTFEGGVVSRPAGPGNVDLQPSLDPQARLSWLWMNRPPLRWDVGVTAEIPLDIRLDTGANRSEIDLTTLRVRRLELHTGASETTVRLPETGRAAVRVECGVASVELRVPAGVRARIAGRMGLGAIAVDETRFPREGGTWASPDFETAADRMDISIDGGLGTVRVV